MQQTSIPLSGNLWGSTGTAYHDSSLSVHPGEKPSLYANMYNLCSVASSECHEGGVNLSIQHKAMVVSVELRLCVIKRRAKDVSGVIG